MEPGSSRGRVTRLQARRNRELQSVDNITMGQTSSSDAAISTEQPESGSDTSVEDTNEEEDLIYRFTFDQERTSTMEDGVEIINPSDSEDEETSNIIEFVENINRTVRVVSSEAADAYIEEVVEEGHLRLGENGLLVIDAWEDDNDEDEDVVEVGRILRVDQEDIQILQETPPERSLSQPDEVVELPGPRNLVGADNPDAGSSGNRNEGALSENLVAAVAGSSNSSAVEQRRIESNGNDSDNESEEEEGPPSKIARLDINSRSEEDDSSCHICYESYDNSGAHRPCCLKCGHIFGKDCIERWIKAQKRCPDCNSKATPRDIRIIYVKNLKTLDTAELHKMKGEIDKLKIEKNKVELTNAQLRCQVQAQSKEIQNLQAQKTALISISRPVKDLTDNFLKHETSTLSKVLEPIPSSSSQCTSLRLPKLQLIKSIPIKEGQSRVGAYNECMNLMVVSHSISSALFPSGCCGIKKINSLDMKAFQSFPIHQRAIRDMAFSLIQNDLLLTVSLDKKAVLFNCNSNCAVQTFNTPSSLWSCCWNSVDQNIFYVGSMTGQVTSYDIRAPQEPLSTLNIPTIEKSGVSRLKFVPPADQNQALNMSGLLIQKLNSVWFCEMLGSNDSNPSYHQLPMGGPFLNADFEPQSRHVLVTARPKQVWDKRVGTTHMVCNLAKTYSVSDDRDIFSCDIVQVMTGGQQESTIMCRSALFSPQQGQTYVVANGESAKTVRVWDVANVEQRTLIRINQDAALDFVHGSVNDTNFVGVITDNVLDMYDIK